VNRNRLSLLAAAVGVAAVVAVVLIVLGSGSGSTSTDTATTTASVPQDTTPVTTSDILTGIPQHGDTLGQASAPATITIFEDPQCPFCRDWMLQTFGTVVTDYVRTGKVKLVYRGIEIIGPNSEPGLRAIYAAGQQNKLWNMVEAMYRLQGAENSGWITEATVRTAAHAAGANANAILGAMNANSVTAKLNEAARQSQTDKVQGTPAFVVQRPPAQAQMLNLPALDAATFESALDAALQ
jgi:protein-disulfide isomerase